MYDGWPSGAVVPISLFSLQETAGSLTLIKTLWPGGSMWLKFLQVSPEMLQNPLNKSLSSMNVSCCSAIVLYYLWLLLWLSEFIAIISQQPSDALGQQSVTLLLGWREWKGHMQWQGTQSSGQACGKDDAILLPESWWDLDGGKRERETAHKERGIRTDEGDRAPCQSSKSQSTRDEWEMLRAAPGAKYLRRWLYSQRP